MKDASPRAIHLKDYLPPAFRVDTVDMDVSIEADHARIVTRMSLQRTGPADAPLQLDGQDLELLGLSLDGRALSEADYQHGPDHLRIPAPPERFVLETTVRIRPDSNTTLSGLYRSRDGYFTQCEAEGFRRITYFLDRPDIMARYRVCLHADREKFPVLLANGNCIETATEAGGRHRAVWEDPFPKPSYLFAMVAARLDCLEDGFTTRSGRDVKLAIYVEPGKLDQCDFAMQALKKSMRWDETRFGLEVDLDTYMIVAVGDFNMGAMENKGLNIFNTKYVLARPDVATDLDYQNIDRVVAHEYFHNWTGNRVTCRDWFQLSLKEGLTVFRDQEYGSDMYSRPVMRIQEVRGLRAAQFPEDAGPMAHPIRPASYAEINNFYTATVYEKGAEVVRMIHTLLGEVAFMAGMRLYFERHDGQAVTCDDFVSAMQDASGVDLTQFRRWYTQAGTPRLKAFGEYDAGAQRYRLTLSQTCPPTAYERRLEEEGLTVTQGAFHVPVAVGLVGPDGRDLIGTQVLSLTADTQCFDFEGIAHRPVPSIARGFSAPVILDCDYDDADLAHLMACDSDAFNRWEAGQQLATRLMLRAAGQIQSGAVPVVPPLWVQAVGRVLESGAADAEFTAEALTLPSEAYLGDQMAVIDPEAAHSVRLAFRRRLAGALRVGWEAGMAGVDEGPYAPDAPAIGRRALRNLCLGYLMELQEADVVARCVRQFEAGRNMTDRLAALSLLVNTAPAQGEQALADFYRQWRHEPLVVDKWLGVQATSRQADALERVQALMSHEAFDLRNPNKVYALVRNFCGANPLHFHAADGRGYRFAADVIAQLDPLNPQVAARIARCFDRWRRFDTGRQAQARAALERIAGLARLSRDVAEVVERSLA